METARSELGVEDLGSFPIEKYDRNEPSNLTNKGLS